MRLGGMETIKVDVRSLPRRIGAAAEMEEGRFREGPIYRLKRDRFAAACAIARRHPDPRAAFPGHSTERKTRRATRNDAEASRLTALLYGPGNVRESRT